jgi:membrane associated rhomboid family serine protease
MFPLRDDNPTVRTSVVTFGIIGLNVAAWVLLQGFGTEPGLSRSICELGAIPGDLLGTVAPGMRVQIGPDAVCVLGGGGRWLTTLSSMFMHGGWFHIASNMWFLAVFGDNVEDSMGPVRFGVFYVLCGLAAVAAQVVSNPASPIPMVGASGAIGGVMGGYAMLYPRAPVHMLIIFGFYINRVVVPAYLMLGYWLVIQLVGAVPALRSEGGGVAFWAHIGGFAAGALLVSWFRDPARVEAHNALRAGRRPTQVRRR